MLYTIEVLGCVEPELRGPFADENQRVKSAKECLNKSNENIVFRLDIDENGKPEVSSFSNSEMETDSEKIIDAYDGFCPDCSDDIPSDVQDGQACENCGHVFCLPQDTDD